MLKKGDRVYWSYYNQTKSSVFGTVVEDQIEDGVLIKWDSYARNQLQTAKYCHPIWTVTDIKKCISSE